MGLASRELAGVGKGTTSAGKRLEWAMARFGQKWHGAGRLRRVLAGRCRPAILGLAGLALLAPSAMAGDAPASRVALVVGEAAYRVGPRPAAAANAGLIAQVLAGAGFAVTAARDLDGDGLRRAVRDFLDKAGAAGPDGIAVVYIAGRAIQAEGETVVVPVDARLARPADVPLETLRLADLTRALAALPIQARVVILDGAYAGGPGGSAPGLALVEAEQGMLIAANAAPGSVASATAGDDGLFAQALAAGLQQGGVPVGEVFARLRLAVNQASHGAVVPWVSDGLTRSFTFFERLTTAPAIASAQIPFAALEKRPLRDFPSDQAYDVAVARDTLPAYAEFIAAFPADPLARRAGLFLALRREALFWRAAIAAPSAATLWTYLLRYPAGPHGQDARRRLTRLAAAAVPPAGFVPLTLDVPPPGRGEAGALHDADRVLASLPAPPPPPVFLLPPAVAPMLPRTAGKPGQGLLPLPVAILNPHVRPPATPGTIVPPRGIVASYPPFRPAGPAADVQGRVAQAAPGAGPVVLAPTVAAPQAPRPPAMPVVPAVPVDPKPLAAVGKPPAAVGKTPAAAAKPPVAETKAPSVESKPPVPKPAVVEAVKPPVHAAAPPAHKADPHPAARPTPVPHRGVPQAPASCGHPGEPACRP